MAESEDDVLEIRVTGDWSEFDRQALDRENRAQTSGLAIRSAGTFGGESPRIGSSGGGGGGLLEGPDVSRAQAAMSRLASALDRQAQQIERGIFIAPEFTTTTSSAGRLQFRNNQGQFFRPQYEFRDFSRPPTELEPFVSRYLDPNAVTEDGYYKHRGAALSFGPQRLTAGFGFGANRGSPQFDSWRASLQYARERMWDPSGVADVQNSIDEAVASQGVIRSIPGDEGDDIYPIRPNSHRAFRVRRRNAMALRQNSLPAQYESGGTDSADMAMAAGFGAYMGTRTASEESSGRPFALIRRETPLARRTGLGRSTVWEGEEVGPRRRLSLPPAADFEGSTPIHEGEVSASGGGGRALPPGADFEGSWSPSPGSGAGGPGMSSVNIPNAAGGGGGGGGAFGGGGGGGAGGRGGGWAGPGMAGAYGGWWGAYNRINPNRTWWERIRNMRFNTGLYYSVLFGAYEVGRASRAAQESQLQASVAPSALEALTAQEQGIQQITGGIIGSTLGLANDIAGAFTPLESPAKLRETLAYETLKNRVFQSSRGEAQQRLLSRNVQAGQLADLYTAVGVSAYAAQRQGQADIATVTLREEQGRIDEQLSGKHWKWLTWNSFKNDEWGEYVNDITDPTTRDALSTRRKLIDTHIKALGDNATFDIAFQRFQAQRAVETQIGTLKVDELQSSLQTERYKDQTARIPADQANILDAERRRAALVQQQAIELKQARFTPELIPALQSRQGAALAAVDAEIVDLKDQMVAGRAGDSISDRGQTVSRQLRGARRFFQASLEDSQYREDADIVGGRLDAYSARRRRAAGANEREEIRAEEKFNNQQALIAVGGNSLALSYLLQNNPLAAQMATLGAQRTLEVGAIDPHRTQLIMEKNKEFDQREALTIKQEAEKRFELSDSLNFGIRTSRLRQRGGPMDFLEASLDSTATGTLADIRGLQRQGLPEDIIEQRRQLGREQVREQRASYYRSMQFGEVGAGRIVANQAGLDSAEARFGAAESRIAEGHPEYKGDSKPVTSTQADQMLEIMRQILTKNFRATMK